MFKFFKEYSDDKILVNRTYSDFEWLQNELVENFPGIKLFNSINENIYKITINIYIINIIINIIIAKGIIVPSIPARKILAKLNISSLTSSIRA